MENNSKYFSEIVYLRAIAIFAVISIHVAAHGDYTEMNGINFLTLLYMSIDTFSHFAVPLFVCISGFVLYNKYQGSFSLKLFYKKRLISVVPQYTIFSILAILFIYAGRIYLGRIWNFSVIDIIFQYFSGTAFYHLWFFVLIIQLYILYPFIERIFTKSVNNHKTLELLFFLLIVQILYEIFSIGNIFLMGTATFFLAYIFYFVVGMYARSHYNTIKNEAIKILEHPYKLLTVFLSATILGIAKLCNEYFGFYLFPQLLHFPIWVDIMVTPVYYLLIFTLCLYTALQISEMIPNTLTKYLQLIGNYSFGIYLIHAFILFVFASLLFPKIGFDMNNGLYYPVVFTVVLILSLVFVHIIHKFPYHEYIIGSSR